VKACSGKFHPLFQFFYFDSLESLHVEPLGPEDTRPLNCHYDAQIYVFGKETHKKLEDVKLFLVGDGALGCELLKNLTLMGASCGSQGN
jgi:ubiquitin-activating enzyme E1